MRALRSRDRIRIRVYTVPCAPAPPDLLAESWHQATAAAAAERALGPVRSPRDLAEGFTRHWPDPHGPDPHGPDPLVFGPGPR